MRTITILSAALFLTACASTADTTDEAAPVTETAAPASSTGATVAGERQLPVVRYYVVADT